MIHPARALSFHDLLDGINGAVAAGHVNQTTDGCLGLYCYTREAVYDRIWTPFTIMSRGLIVDLHAKKIIATPFPKFWNLGENEHAVIKAGSFEVFEKLDGSLIILWFYGGRWRASTKGSFNSDQAMAAQAIIDKRARGLIPGNTYLLEYIGPQNRIVVHYQEEELVLLSAYDENGREVTYDILQSVGEGADWRVATRHECKSISDLVVKAETLPPSEEGYVVRYADGSRLKIKGEQYKRVHQLISRCTPLAMWEAMMAGDDMTKIRRDLPEEFWADYDAITAALGGRIAAITHAVAGEAAAVAALSDKEVGLRLSEFSPDVRSFIFPFRKTGTLLEGRTRAALFRHIRPTGNRMDGYVPSYAMNRVAEEMV